MENNAVIVGIDEAGRGALAGPVVAGACILTHADIHPFVQDSKKLEPIQREEAYKWITSHCIYGVGLRSAKFVDDNGILAATESAMQDAVADVAKKQQPTYLLVDGRDKFWFDYPHSSVIRGDELEPCISAASIVAKVTRDRLLVEMDTEYPEYGLAEHKGYGTPEHQHSIHKYGPSSIHRTTFLTKILSSAAA